MSLISPAIFTLLLWPSNCLFLSLILTFTFLSTILLSYLKKSDAGFKEIIIPLVILLILSYFFVNLHTSALITNQWPGFIFVARPWPVLFESERIYSDPKVSEYSLMFTDWNFEGPDCYVSKVSHKYFKDFRGTSQESAQVAVFFYFNQNNVKGYFESYVEKLKSKGFKESKLNLSPNGTFKHVTILDHATLENEKTILHCELLNWRNNKAAIFVVIANKGEMDLLRRLVR
jgi:hypothetical protein